MDVEEHIVVLREEGIRLADAAERAGLEAAVPTCPEWRVRDLVRHQGGIHRWAHAIVSTPRTEFWDVDLDVVVGEWPDDTRLLEWFRHGHAELVDGLIAAPPTLECWTFLKAPSPRAMWARRQTHETTIHRVDAELAAGGPLSEISATVAADGVDELLRCFITRRGGRLRADPARTLGVRCTDTTASWLVHIGPDGVETDVVAPDAAAECVVTGAASDLYLTMWSRAVPTAIGVDGDRAVLDLFLDTVHVRWS